MKICSEQKEVLLTGQCLPPFLTGTVTMTAKMGVNIEGKEECSRKQEMQMRVSGERFVLPDNDVDSVYPAKGEICARCNMLPHLVMNRCTQPFECAVLKAEKKGLAIPYLALLLFYEEEIPVLQQGIVREMFELPGKQTAFFPVGYCKGEEQKACSFIDISMELFWNIVPRLTELPLLVHGRKIKPQLKCLQKGSKTSTDMKSAIICNRMPKYGTQELPARNMVCLVSLEGCGEVLQEKKNEYVKIRLPVLYHWEFYAMENPEASVGLEQVYTKGIAPAYTKEQNAAEILCNGYVPLSHHFREGSRLISFYRGPLVPENVERTDETAESPDRLYRYDPEIGMFDVSYAAAWQLGNLLALSKECIAKKILFVRTTVLSKKRKKEIRNLLSLHGVCCFDGANPEALENQMLELLERCYGEKGSTHEIMVSEESTQTGNRN